MKRRSPIEPVRPTPQDKATVYEIITKKIIDKLEQGQVPWHKPWVGGLSLPHNLSSKKPYRGVNILLLAFEGYTSPWWLTWKQCKEMGGVVKEEEKKRGTIIVFWKPFYEDGQEQINPKVDKQRKVKGMMMRYYRVYNIEQTEGIPSKKIPGYDRGEDFNPIPHCESIVANMPLPPAIKHGFAGASYLHGLDEVRMPHHKQFNGNSSSYYAVLFHELVHSTGHSRRLDRFKKQGFDDSQVVKYSQEELIAEIGGCFLCGHAGIDVHVIDNSVNYINHWRQALSQDPKLIIKSASEAQKAADYIFGQ